MSRWISPDDTTDPGFDWTNDSFAIDGFTSTYAYGAGLVKFASSPDLTFINSPIFYSCQFIKCWCSFDNAHAGSLIELRVRYSGTWYTIADFVPLDDNQWQTFDIGSVQDIQFASIRLQSFDDSAPIPRIHELQLFKIEYSLLASV